MAQMTQMEEMVEGIVEVLDMGARAFACRARCGYESSIWRGEAWGPVGGDGLIRASEAVFLRRCGRCGVLQSKAPAGMVRACGLDGADGSNGADGANVAA